MRKLAIGCLAFSAAVFLSNYIVPSTWLPYCALTLGAAGAALVLLRRKTLRAFIIIALSACVGFLCFFVRDFYIGHVVENTVGATTELHATLLDYPRCYDNYCRGEVRLVGEGVPHVKALLYDSGMFLENAVPGQKLSFTAKIKAADVRYGEEYDQYNSKRVYLILNSRSDIELSAVKNSLLFLPQRLRHDISQLAKRIFPADIAPFICSLLLGDKSDFYQNVGLYVSMSRAGFMHVVAISGMHIAFLIGFLQLVLGVSRNSSFICIAVVWFFVLLTGSGPAAVRAGFMQSLLLLAPILKRESDAITSLSFALALILSMNPYAAGSVSLQLSFAAMAGIILFSERLYQMISGCISSDKLRKALSLPLQVFSCSLAVMAFTVPLSAIHFENVSVLAPLMNILGLWAVSVIFCGALAACGLGIIIPAMGTVVAWLISWLVRYIYVLAGLISKLPFSALYLSDSSITAWLVLSYVLIIIAVFTKASAKFKLTVPAAASVVALAVALLVSSASYASGDGVITMLDVGQGQCICVFSGDSTVMIDCGGIGTQTNAGETAGAYLSGCRRGKIDVLVLTHLHADHCNGVPMLMEMTKVDVIYLPEGADDEDDMFVPIFASARKHGTDVRFIREDTSVQCGDIGLDLYFSQGAGDINERGIMLKASIGDYDMIVTGDAAKASELELIENHKIRNIELLAVGHHGSRYSTAGDFLESLGADTAFISVGYNTYGHPTYEVLERLDAYGYNIYRTDLSGNLELRIG